MAGAVVAKSSASLAASGVYGSGISQGQEFLPIVFLIHLEKLCTRIS